MYKKRFLLTTYLLITYSLFILTGCESYKYFFQDMPRNNPFDAKGTEYIGNDYFPLKVGLTWTYQVTITDINTTLPPNPDGVDIGNVSEGYKTTQITKETIIEGIKYYYIENFPDSNLQGYIGKNSTGDIISYNQSTRQIQVVYKFSNGTGKIRTEPVIVPAGTFNNCYSFFFPDQPGSNDGKWLNFDFNKGLVSFTYIKYYNYIGFTRKNITDWNLVRLDLK